MSTTYSRNTSPPSLPEAKKFDGTNYLEWLETILMACRLQGAQEYLEGTIPKPEFPKAKPLMEATDSIMSPTFTTTTTTSDTKWTSTTPSWEEWDTRDAWCHIAICQNIKNPLVLGLKNNGTASEAWKSLTN
ncbi:hypothetical protein B0H34DRAFT_654000, partial [Crassisporium funariophilum]